ncbi:MAG: hypothetical protein LBO03_03890 [Acidaminococcales bacterium]|jgi:hypothetical protein|nr:hypothetical protein [Acidaminococcales bacterium]
MPKFKNPIDATMDEMRNDIDALFLIFDHIEWLQFVGGEIFLHNALADTLEYCKKYKDKFDLLVIESNATILPRGMDFDVLESYGPKVKVMISNYGNLSRQLAKFTEELDKRKIQYILKRYYGNEQHCGGWIDNTARRDLLEPDSFVALRSALCPQVRLENMHVYRGKLHRCSNSLFLSELGVCILNDRDYVELEPRISLAEKRDIIKSFYGYPRKSCHYCTWKDADSLLRHPAAEQLNEALFISSK